MKGGPILWFAMLVFIATFSFGQSENRLDAPRDTGPKPRANQEITLTGPISVKLVPQEMSAEAAGREAAEHVEHIDNERKSTQANEDMVHWTSILVWVSGIQAVFLVWTLTLTRRSTAATERAITIQTAQKRQGSVFWIAERFENQAGEWADRAFQIDAEQVKTHNTILNTLSTYVDYIHGQYPVRFAAIKEAWTLFHGGDMGTPIAQSTYLSDPKFKSKDFWVRQLFTIAAQLRAIEPEE
jgi:hypothetical protein